MKNMKIGLIGAGAVGGMLSLKLEEAYKDNFFLVARDSRAMKYRTEGLCINDKVIYPNVTEDEKLDFLLVTVKNYSLHSAMEDMRKVVSKNTIILPLLNGIAATDKIKEYFPDNRVLYGIVLRTDAERKNGGTYFTVSGEIQMGYANNTEPREEVLMLQRLLTNAGVTAVIYPDMKYMLWRKWMINIGANQISMLAEAPFKYFGLFEEIQIAVRKSIEEIQIIAEKAGVGLTKKDVEEIIRILVNYPPEKKSSMLQDFEAHRKTEIDYFAGTVMKLGKEYGVPTPVNEILYYVIKARERIYLESVEH